ncbi:EscU/YscU/HrcU family type III secretion system export apparatus switch protein [Bacillus sp. S/N-304-OC-R1]|uniref:EscU/YscU/HrcU family type III secretion system export apparatus switch protein n=1 Tax=Bacillus sp. S/N-304-OC-R1 TaxID=2758034 RepID=UPI001C8CF6A5|nr:EscU/YscU/HrcU family type III secretion system export apparatus switch protein [Bacillus sp. S/N-304-OC-R1]MBY0120711.1 EscU/YscU/HrcU family type III secretion system export apparatus switch protein [Bacillus sp. S/N-304-OC-R1]
MSNQIKQLRKEAVALTYDKTGGAAPYVSAKGKGLIADSILAKAKEHDIPVQEDPSLVELLGKLNINEQIPEELYGAVAEVFAFIYKADQEAGKITPK